MKSNSLFTPIVISCVLFSALTGCATIKEMGRGFAGISTKVLEDTRKDALKRSYRLDYDTSYAEVKKILGRARSLEEDKGPYIYAENAAKKLIAVYVSEADTTPVGIFFTVEGKNRTLIEISSPSVYAKEYMAKDIFGGMDKMLKSGTREKKADVEK